MNTKQTKPVRRLGGDITQSTLQLTLDTYGIDRGIESLSYAEKRLVIVTAMLNQTDEAWLHQSAGPSRHSQSVLSPAQSLVS